MPFPNIKLRRNFFQPIIGCAVLIGGFNSCGSDKESTTIFELIVENISPRGGLTGAAGDPQEIVFATGAGAVHVLPSPLYVTGQGAPVVNGLNGLEKFAEDADPTDLIEVLQANPDVSVIVLATTPTQELSSGGVLRPGETYRVVFNAERSNSRLSFALPDLQANDSVVGTADAGVALFNEDGTPRSGDITSAFSRIDVGTEVNEPPAQGPNQIARQPMPNLGGSEARPVGPVADGFSYPPVASTLRVTVNLVQEVS